jgi:hypothetical protein
VVPFSNALLTGWKSGIGVGEGETAGVAAAEAGLPTTNTAVWGMVATATQKIQGLIITNILSAGLCF